MPQKEDSSNELGKSQLKRKSVYQQKTRVHFMCRVCLTRSNSMMYHLYDKSALSQECYLESKEITIHEALQQVTASKITLQGEFPRCICPDCFSLLKTSLKFIYQFEESQNKLKKMIGESNFVSSQKDLESKSNIFSMNDQKNPEYSIEAPVELIYGENKFSLSDLLVVEKSEDPDCDFKGFLSNLGKEVTATFADNYEYRLEKDMLENTNQEQVTISLVGKDKILPVKELQVDEETNTIKCVVVENDNESDDIAEEILRLEIEKDDDIDNEIVEMEVKDIDVKSLVKNGIVKMNKKGVDQIKKVSKMGKEDIKQEVDDIFEREMRFPCDICGKIFDFIDRLRAHKRRTHSNQVKVYNCDICGYKNNTLSAHKHHKTKHVGKKWSCDICKKSYYTKAVLKVHLETHRNRRQHLCTVCGKGFNYANALIYHMRLHTGEKNYICEYCNQRFRMPNSLNRHIRCHTGERPYQCRFCDKAFRSKGELSCHESGHTGCRPYHCKYCRKGFSKTHNLKLHLLSHGGPHECELCGRNFIEPAILSMHYKISHRDIDGRMVKKKEDD